MTVGELIQKLQEYDHNLKISVVLTNGKTTILSKWVDVDLSIGRERVLISGEQAPAYVSDRGA